jgi:hypothetical protein
MSDLARGCHLRDESSLLDSHAVAALLCRCSGFFVPNLRLRLDHQQLQISFRACDKETETLK